MARTAIRPIRKVARMSLGIASPSTVRNANRSQKATVLDSQNRWSGRTRLAGDRRLDEGPADAPRPPIGQDGDRRQLARAGPVDADLGARDDRATLVGDEESPPVEVAWVEMRLVDRSWIALASASRRGPDNRPGRPPGSGPMLLMERTLAPDWAYSTDAARGVPPQARLREDAGARARPAGPRRGRPCWPVVGSSSRSIARRACTTTSGWRSTACSPRGPSRRARPSTRRSGGWRSTSRTTRWSTSTSRA